MAESLEQTLARFTEAKERFPHDCFPWFHYTTGVLFLCELEQIYHVKDVIAEWIDSMTLVDSAYGWSCRFNGAAAGNVEGNGRYCEFDIRYERLEQDRGRLSAYMPGTSRSFLDRVFFNTPFSGDQVDFVLSWEKGTGWWLQLAGEAASRRAVGSF